MAWVGIDTDQPGHLDLHPVTWASNPVTWTSNPDLADLADLSDHAVSDGLAKLQRPTGRPRYPSGLGGSGEPALLMGDDGGRGNNGRVGLRCVGVVVVVRPSHGAHATGEGWSQTASNGWR
ncbi:hypothetical protein GCM10009742_69220 [Kribbella karoonensis]|uniref:Uncharacterized protein n=1 Tax=Kribbella karoonensis TaxID=324851 RepID=A0ABN2EK10_9ACTN